jgi:hypothetical protein
VITINLPAWATDQVDFQDLIARHRQEAAAHGGAGDVGSVFVAASDAAVTGLEKQAFHATTAEGYDHDSAVSLQGVRSAWRTLMTARRSPVTVMPCSHGHEFHPVCITKFIRASRSPIRALSAATLCPQTSWTMMTCKSYPRRLCIIRWL